MHIFKTRHFQRWMRKTALGDSDLRKAVLEMTAGLIDADLGGGVVKKRIGLAGRGKRDGVRTLVATNKGNRWFFVFGFEKNERDNISDAELQALQDYAAIRGATLVVASFVIFISVSTELLTTIIYPARRKELYAKQD